MRKVIVVAPTYNEEENIGSFLTAVLKEQKNLKDYNLGVLISDSHSGDKTAEIVKKAAAKNKNIHYLDVEKRGLGLGIIKGIDYAVEKFGADIIITMEADLSNNPNEISEFIKKIDQGADVVIGSRYCPGGQIVNWSWWRKAFSQIANHSLKLFATSSPISEFTNLYRAFTKAAWQEIRPRVKMYVDWIFVPAFAFEILAANFKVVELPIIYYDRFGGRSKMRTLSYSKNLLHYAVRYRLKKYDPLS